MQENISKLVADNEAKNIKIEDLTKQVEEYRQAYDRLSHQLKDLLRNRFGSSSERFIDPENPQGNLFSENGIPLVESVDDDETTTVPSHIRKKRKKVDTSKYPRTIKIIPVDEAERICSCGCEKVLIR